MSSAPASRLKDRPAVAGPKTATAQKPLKIKGPVSTSDLNPSSALKKSTSGKENTRSNPRAQKPAIRPVPRVDKAAVAAGTGSDGGEVRVRWSTSSAPRGRSQSPSEFIRVFRDSRISKVESDSITRLVSSAGRKNEISSLRDCTENGRFAVEFGKDSGICAGNDLKVEESKNSSSSKFATGNKEVNLSLTLTKSSVIDDVGDLKVQKFDHLRVVDKLGSGIKSISIEEFCQKSCIKSKILDNLKEKGVIVNGVDSGGVGVKYPSKLHDKLAFLEGKVKRIASDIKKTKEMLDMNNPDASKMILSDIQNKILGIEKAMGNVVGDSSNGNDAAEKKVVEKCETKKADSVKGLVVGLHAEELEARLFPHHKLLRNRTALKGSVGHVQSHDESNIKPNSETKVEHKLLGSTDDNLIALEFLTSLSKENAMVTVREAKVGVEISEVKETDVTASDKQETSNMFNGKSEEELILTTDETLDEFDDQENRHEIFIEREIEDKCVYQLNDIGSKSSTGGWFVSEGESTLLAHDDGSCSFYDIANCEEKAVYKPPTGVSPNIWRDCWIIRAPSADGCSGRYVVAASAGNTLDSGFCSWDFYTKDVRAFHIEDEGSTPRTILAPLSNNTSYTRNALSSIPLPENRQWWYKPCGPLIVSAASSQRIVKIFDIRDGEQIMQWEVQKPVLAMDYSSPLQWRNRGKLVVAEAETISVWDVNSLNPQSVLSVSSSGQKISALHVVNTDAELGGGVRQRVSSVEAEGNDGVFCTPDAINVLDFRHPSGVGVKIPKVGLSSQSIYSRGDSVYVGGTNMRSAGKKQPCPQVQQFSLRKQRLVSSYSLPESNAHPHYSAITQVWGNSNLVMGVCGLGLFVFDALKEDMVQSFAVDHGTSQKVKDVIGPDDLYSPSFDYLASRVLLISRDRPAMWRHLPASS